METIEDKREIIDINIISNFLFLIRNIWLNRKKELTIKIIVINKYCGLLIKLNIASDAKKVIKFLIRLKKVV